MAKHTQLFHEIDPNDVSVKGVRENKTLPVFRTTRNSNGLIEFTSEELKSERFAGPLSDFDPDKYADFKSTAFSSEKAFKRFKRWKKQFAADKSAAELQAEIAREAMGDLLGDLNSMAAKTTKAIWAAIAEEKDNIEDEVVRDQLKDNAVNLLAAATMYHSLLVPEVEDDE